MSSRPSSSIYRPRHGGAVRGRTPPAHDPWSALAGALVWGAGVLIVLVFVAAAIGLGAPAGDRIAANVSAGAVDLSGLDRATARARLEAAFVAPAQLAINLSDGTTLSIELSAIDYRYDIDAALDQAFAIDRANDPVGRIFDRLGDIVGHGLAVPLTFDRQKLDTQISNLLDQIEITRVDAALAVEASGIAVRPAVAGRQTDAHLLATRLNEWLAQPSAAALDLPVETYEPAIPTSAANDGAASAHQLTDQPLALLDAGAPLIASPATLRGWLSTAWSGDHFTLEPHDAAIRSSLLEMSSSLTTRAVPATITYTATGFVTTPAADGQVIDIDSSARAIVAALDQRAAGLGAASASLTLTVDHPVFDDAAAQAALALAERVTVPLTISAGAKSVELDQPALAALWTFAVDASSGIFEPTINTVELDRQMADVAAQLAVDGQPSHLGFADGHVVVLPSVIGHALDLPAATAQLRALLNQRLGGSESATLALSMIDSEPTGPSVAELAALAARMSMVSTWTTQYIKGPSTFYGKNLTIPTAKLDGYVVAPGEVFDFLTAIGPVTEAEGYGPGGVIKNGKLYMTGALGGGLCSPSTTVWNAAMRLGLQIVERHPHGFYIARFPLGLDATVFEQGDFRRSSAWANDTDYPIVIHTSYTNHSITYELWSVPNGRRIVLSDPIVTNIDRAVMLDQPTDTLPAGQTNVIQEAFDGQTVVVTRTVYAADGALLYEDTWRSNYRRLDGIRLVGQ